MNNLATIDTTINNIASQYVNTISQYKWSIIPDSQLQAAKQALTKSDYLMKIACSDPGAVQDALIKSAVLGLDLTEGKRQGWLLPRKNASGKTTVTLQVGYKGVEAIHQRMGVIDRLSIRVVRENDDFEWSGNDSEKPDHKADWMASEETRGPIKGAFSITYFPDGSIQVMVASIEEIYTKHRDVSDSWKSYQSKISKGEKAFPPPWVSYEKSMIEKTMAYIASKQWPANIRDQELSSKILETLHQTDVADYVTLNRRYSDKQLKIFINYVKGDDDLGYYLFMERLKEKDLDAAVGIELDYIGEIPRGGKGKERDRLGVKHDMGLEELSALKVLIESDDVDLLREQVSEMSDTTVFLLKESLNAEHIHKFNEMVGEA